MDAQAPRIQALFLALSARERFQLFDFCSFVACSRFPSLSLPPIQIRHSFAYNFPPFRSILLDGRGPMRLFPPLLLVDANFVGVFLHLFLCLSIVSCSGIHPWTARLAERSSLSLICPIRWRDIFWIFHWTHCIPRKFLMF